MDTLTLEIAKNYIVKWNKKEQSDQKEFFVPEVKVISKEKKFNDVWPVYVMMNNEQLLLLLINEEHREHFVKGENVSIKVKKLERGFLTFQLLGVYTKE